MRILKILVYNLAKKGNKPVHDISLLLEDQAHFIERFIAHPHIQLVRTVSLDDKATHERLLEALNIFGNWFQRMIYMRAAVGGPPAYQNLAIQHIQEEIGHDTSLFKMRGSKEITWYDPILEATCSWFFEKMLSAPVEEKTVLMHFVVEGSGDVFHKEALRLFGKASHFTTHVELDEDHFAIGCRILASSGNFDIERLRLVLKQGWEMFYLLASRFAYYAQYGESGADKDYKKAS